MRLLLVEDDSRIAHFVARGLQEQAYAVDVVANGDDALYQVEINDYDVIVLDVMIPGKDGFATCRGIRSLGKRTPILMLTARDAVDDRIRGLDSGADDYLTKPFEFGELLARLRALLRRPRDFVLRGFVWVISNWIQVRRQRNAAIAPFRSLPKNMRFWNFWRVMPIASSGGRRLPNMSGTSPSILSQILSRFT